VQFTLALLFVTGAIVFPVGYHTAYIRYPLPAYAGWRHNEAIIEDTKFTNIPQARCDAKMWFVTYHTSSGLLEQPKRIVTWADWTFPGEFTVKECSALRGQRKQLYYDTHTPTDVLQPTTFQEFQASYEDSHKYGVRLFWIGVACISCVLVPITMFLAGLVGRGLLHGVKSGGKDSSVGQL